MNHGEMKVSCEHSTNEKAKGLEKKILWGSYKQKS